MREIYEMVKPGEPILINVGNIKLNRSDMYMCVTFKLKIGYYTIENVYFDLYLNIYHIMYGIPFKTIRQTIFRILIKLSATILVTPCLAL